MRPVPSVGAKDPMIDGSEANKEKEKVRTFSRTNNTTTTTRGGGGGGGAPARREPREGKEADRDKKPKVG